MGAFVNRLRDAIAVSILSLGTVTACGSDDSIGSDCAPSCAARIVGQGLGPRKLTVDEQNVYWLDGFNNNDQTLRRVPRAGGQSATLATGENLHDLVLDGGFVYFSNASKIQKVPKQGGNVETLIDRESGLVGLALADGKLYWSSTNGVRAMPVT